MLRLTALVMVSWLAAMGAAHADPIVTPIVTALSTVAFTVGTLSVTVGQVLNVVLIARAVGKTGALVPDTPPVTEANSGESPPG